MRFNTIFLLAFSLMLFSCNEEKTNAKEDHSGHDHEQKHEESHDDHQADNKEEALKLNDGAKWDINQEMMPPLKSMENNIHDFNDSEEKDYKLLADNLQEDISALISSCTMKGKSHDELHKWLVPYMNLVEELSEARGDKSAEKTFLQIQEAFAVFNQYFN
jgi:hypothetical protein